MPGRLGTQQFQDLNSRMEVQLAGRLVGQQHRIVGGQGARDGNALLLAARELVREVVLPVHQPDLFEPLARDRGRVLSPRSVCPELHVLERGQPREEVEGLEDETRGVAAVRGQVAARGTGDRLPSDAYLAARRNIQASDKVQQCGLAAARGTQHDDELAGMDGQVDPGEGGDVQAAEVVDAADIPELDHGGTVRSTHVRRGDGA